MAIGIGPFNAYTDVQTLLQARSPAMPLGDYLGAHTVLTQATTVGGQTLTVTSSEDVPGGQMVIILDGPQSEIVFSDPASPTPTENTIALQSPGCQFVHPPMADVSCGGPSGVLALVIRDASAYLENYCQQGSPGDRGLFTKVRTEKLRMPTTHAMIDPFGALKVRPRSFPIQSLTAVAIEYAPGNSLGFAPTQVELESDARSFTLPFMLPLPGASNAQLLDVAPIGRGDQAWCVISYTAGMAWATMPWEITTACNLMAQEFLGYGQNPTGAATVRQGDTMLVQRQKGSGGKETSIDSLLMSQAKVMLESYRNVFI